MRFLMLACLWTLFCGVARADDFDTKWSEALKEAEPKPEPDFFAGLDKSFGGWVVGPLANIILHDVLYWDNTLPAGEGIGTLKLDSEPNDPGLLEVTGYDPAEGYTWQRLTQVPETVPMLAQPETRRIGSLNVNLQKEMTDAGPVVMARIPTQAADPVALGVPAWDPDGPEQPIVSVMVKELGFMVPVDRRTMTVDPADGPAPEGLVQRTVDQPVWVPSLKTELLFAGGTEGKWRVRQAVTKVDPKLLPNPNEAKLPVIVAWLVFGATFFTIRMTFINLRGFRHALAVVSGRYDHPDHPGEISHFQALSSALSATVGLGNIAGVAIAIGLGGPGAIFWMWCAGFLGMASKFTECTLGQMYRVTDAAGVVSGGPMHYLDRGLAELGLGAIGKGLAILFAVMCIGGSFGGGNMFQANQSLEAIAEVVPIVGDYPWAYGILLMLLVGVVIIGGIKRIGAAASLVVPLMCGLYVAAGLYVLVTHAGQVPAAFLEIIRGAFAPEAGLGGMVGVLAIGFQRASFSNEAGVGSASIAHSAASTDEPVREGIVALLEPFIDTIIVCSVTALVVVVTGVRVPPGSGIKATMDAFATTLPWFPWVLAVAAMLFAFSTMVSWSYYGERAAVWLFGPLVITPYRVVFLCFVFIGSVIKLGNVLDFSDLMILGMAFPNILGALLLSTKVKKALDAYWAKLEAGEFG